MIDMDLPLVASDFLLCFYTHKAVIHGVFFRSYSRFRRTAVPVGIALLALAWRYLKETERHTGHFDLAGALTVTFGMSALVYCFVRAGAQGWNDALALGTLTLTQFAMSVYGVKWLARYMSSALMFCRASRTAPLISKA